MNALAVPNPHRSARMRRRRVPMPLGKSSGTVESRHFPEENVRCP